MTARTPTSLPKGRAMADYDSPKIFRVGKPIEQKSKWQEELEQAKRWLKSGETVVQVPGGTTQVNWANQLRTHLSKNGEVPTICKIGDTELYVRLIGA